MEIFLIIVAVIGYFVLRTICPNCKKVLCRTSLGSEEIDRWQGTKKVEVEIKQRAPNDNVERRVGSRTEHVPCTYIKLAHWYCCDKCGHKWYKTEKKEMK